MPHASIDRGDRRIHGHRTVENLGADRCRVSLGAWSWVALATQIGRFDATIEIESPAELAAAFESLSRRFAAVGPARTRQTEPTAR